MAAEVLRLPETTVRVTTPVRGVLTPIDRHTSSLPLPFPTPLLHPRAVEALLLAFAPVDEKE